MKKELKEFIKDNEDKTDLIIELLEYAWRNSNKTNKEIIQEALKVEFFETEFCESNDFQKNNSDQYIYTSSKGNCSFNLPYILSDYLDFLKEKGYKIIKP